jgi:hypothetical protein
LAHGRQHLSHHAADQLTPETLFDRAWAMTLLDRVLARLQAENEAARTGRHSSS